MFSFMSFILNWYLEQQIVFHSSASWSDNTVPISKRKDLKEIKMNIKAYKQLF